MLSKHPGYCLKTAGKTRGKASIVKKSFAAFDEQHPEAFCFLSYHRRCQTRSPGQLKKNNKSVEQNILNFVIPKVSLLLAMQVNLNCVNNNLLSIVIINNSGSHCGCVIPLLNDNHSIQFMISSNSSSPNFAEMLGENLRFKPCS